VLIESGSPHPDLAAITGEDGFFSFGQLPPGSYIIMAVGTTFCERVNVSVFKGRIAFVEISVDSNSHNDSGDDEDKIGET